MNGPIGLDFGTSTTFLATSDRAGRTSIVPLGAASAETYLPSVAIPSQRGFDIGEVPDLLDVGVIRSVKRCITRDQDSAFTEGKDSVAVDADEVIAAILGEAVRRAEFLQTSIFSGRGIRLGCPAMWDGPQRRRLAEIAIMQGLDVSVEDIIDEPIAAGIGWVTSQRERGQLVRGRVLVIDIGGGTLDVAVLNVEDDGNHSSFTVLSADAQDEAGDDIDKAIATELEENLTAQGKDPQAGPKPDVAKALLRNAARTLKTRLSSSPNVTTNAPSLLGVPTLSYSRIALNDRLDPMLARAEALVRSVLASSRLRERHAPTAQAIARSLGEVTRDVQYVLLTGGSSQIPYVRDFFTSMFPDAQVKWDDERNAQQMVALGLAASDSYDRLNLHRPPFDIVAVRVNGEEQKLYEAFTPLYERHQVLAGHNSLGHMVELRNDSSSNETVEVICRNLVGVQIPFETVGATSHASVSAGLTLQIPGRGWGKLKLYLDGRILLSTANDTASYRMQTWPHVRSDERGVPAPIQLIQEAATDRRPPLTGLTPGEPG